jgi:hypothetical protein
MINALETTVLVLTLAVWADGQTIVATTPSTSPTEPSHIEPAHPLSFSAALYTYIVPDQHDYVQPTITADHNWLHLEARYNYEALDTGSIWLGYNFAGGEKIAWELTPMLGGVLGNTVGVAPGYRGSVSWWKLTLFSEGEYVFDVRESSDSFFYNWSELTIAPVEWLHVGVAGQRTRAYGNDRNVQFGFVLGLSYKQLALSTYVFNPTESKPTVVISLSLTI